MAIPKLIFQTFKSEKLPLVTRWHIRQLKKRNPSYDYCFFNDKDIENFIESEFDNDTFNLYKRINIGAAKADFFRYAVLYKRGGVYLDIDSQIITPLHEIIRPTDSAIISLESQKRCYVQYALFFEKGHPFMKNTLNLVIDNLTRNRFPDDVHSMTGPTAYTKAVKDCLATNPSVKYRETGCDYDDKVRFSYKMSKFFLYGLSRKEHWKKQARHNPLLRE